MMYILDYIYYGCMLLLIGISIYTVFLCDDDLIDIMNIIVSMLIIYASSTILYLLLRSML